MKLAFSWDDGALEDQKLFELHEKYQIPGMFFVPTKNREGREVLSPNIIKRAESQYVSFGGHTENHTYLTTIPLQEVEEEVLNNKKYLEDILGHEILDFCLPGGKYTPEINELVFKHYRTIRTADTMNFLYNGGSILKPSFHVYRCGLKSMLGNALRHNSFDELAYIIAHPLHGDFRLIREIIERKRKKSQATIMIWGHSWEIEKYQLWRELEEIFTLAKKIGCNSYSEMFT